MWVLLWLFRLLLRKYYCCGDGLDYHSGGVAAVVLGFYYRLEWIFLTFLEATHGEMCKGLGASLCIFVITGYISQHEPPILIHPLGGCFGYAEASPFLHQY